MKKRKQVLRIVSIVLALAILFLIPIVLALQDTIIVMQGIRSFRTIRNVTFILCPILSIANIVLVFKVTSKWKEEKVNVENKDMELTVLSETKTLKLLADGKWGSRFTEVDSMISDVNIVIEYYKTIGEEIDEGVNFELADTRSVLEKVILAMSRYVRHSTRLLKVMSREDEKEVGDEIFKSYERTLDLRNKAQDFVMSVLDYMNEDTSESDALTHICSFKEVVLHEVDLVDKYIKEGNN